MKYEELSSAVIQASIEVHRQLGPGLLESSYQQCLAYELSSANVPFTKEVELPVQYKGINLNCGYRLDFLVDDKLIVELKSVEKLERIHQAQTLTYMKLAKVSVALLINFNVEVLRQGIKRVVL